MDPSTWWIAAALAVAAELATGTFYLLMLALGLVAAALAAHLQASLAVQLLAAALLGGGAVALWTLRRSHETLRPPAVANPDVNPDIGQRVHVSRWAADGSTRVSYRGAAWSARWQDGPSALPAVPGDYVIHAVEGSQLLLGH